MAEKNEKVLFLVEEFPKNTQEIYICGSITELGEWNSANAKKLNFDGDVYFLEVEIPIGEEIQYKYLAKKDWGSVECGVVANDIQNRSITTKSSKKRTVYDNIVRFKNI